jgi:hypothetical protein
MTAHHAAPAPSRIALHRIAIHHAAPPLLAPPQAPFDCNLYGSATEALEDGQAACRSCRVVSIDEDGETAAVRTRARADHARDASTGDASTSYASTSYASTACAATAGAYAFHTSICATPYGGSRACRAVCLVEHADPDQARPASAARVPTCIGVHAAALVAVRFVVTRTGTLGPRASRR